ncbi:MAG: hypothetical protein ACM3PT_03570 [Deltaproteobacteria bacterium]
MKRLLPIIIVLITMLKITGFAQTSIGPTFGVSFSEIIETQDALHGDCPSNDFLFNKKGFPHKSFVFGIRADQEIFDWLKIELKTDYALKKLVDDNCRSFDLKYNAFNCSFLFDFMFNKEFNIGIGAAFSNHHNYNFGQMYIKQENFLGYIVSSSYKHKNILFTLSFNSLKNIDKENLNHFRLILSSKSLELSAGYMFELRKKQLINK